MITFWNGNKSPARQRYELELLQLLMNELDGSERIAVDNSDRPNAQDEGEILSRGADILVTVAGNKKFSGQPFHEVKTPLCKGLLGWRLLIVASEKLTRFESITLDELKTMKVGVPDTWVDAELFRANGFDVLEKGTLEDMLAWVQDGSVDFITLGANEAHDILKQLGLNASGLAIEPTMALYYPFPLVFYVNEHQTKLAQQLKGALQKPNPALDELFNHHYAEVLERANLKHRHVFSIDNPLLPDGYSELLNQYL